MKLLNKISAIISWYEGLNQDFSDLGLLIENRRALACLSFEMAKHTGEYKRQFRVAYFARKSKFASKVMEHKEGNTVSAAEAKALIDCKKEMEEEANCEGIKDKGMILLTQINYVLDGMNQHISILRKEVESWQD